MSATSEDPLLRSSRREAIVAGVVFLVALTYNVVYCSLYGYNRSAESLTFVLGFPDWVFWGVLAPWAACTLFACWFSYYFMEDQDLEQESGPSAGEVGLEEAAAERSEASHA